MDFSAKDKASGVKFCTVVHQRPWQGISHFSELCAPTSANPVSSDDVAKRCVYVLLSHNGAPLRECINKHRNVFTLPSSPDGGTGDKV